MHFPRLVYKCPGPHRKRGHSYRYQGCVDADQFAVLAKQGWFPSFEEAIVGNQIEEIVEAVQAADEAIDEIGEPTRDEMEQKARELEIPFNSRTSDKVLAQRIADAV